MRLSLLILVPSSGAIILPASYAPAAPVLSQVSAGRSSTGETDEWHSQWDDFTIGIHLHGVSIGLGVNIDEIRSSLLGLSFSTSEGRLADSQARSGRHHSRQLLEMLNLIFLVKVH